MEIYAPIANKVWKNKFLGITNLLDMKYSVSLRLLMHAENVKKKKKKRNTVDSLYLDFDNIE